MVWMLIQGPLSWTGQEMVEAIQRLLDSSLATHLEQDATKLKSGRELNLRLAGQVWEKVESAKEVSVNELQATRKDWKSVLGLLDDCLEEVKEMEEAAAGEEEEEEEEDEDDFRSSHPLSPLELSRVSASHMILRLSRLLLNRLIVSTAPSQSSSSYSSSDFLSSSRKLVQQLSEKADEFAASLEPPQVHQGVVQKVEEFVGVARGLSSVVEKAVKGVGEGEEGVKEVKWQVMWREQLEKSLGKLISLEE